MSNVNVASRTAQLPAALVEWLVISYLLRETAEPNVAALLDYMRATHDESGEIYESLVPAVSALLDVPDAAAGLVALDVEESVLAPLVMRGDFLDLEAARAWALIGAWLRSMKETT